MELNEIISLLVVLIVLISKDVKGCKVLFY